MNTERMPSLSGLRVFEVAARSGSFQAAAVTLSISNSAVSHAVRSLEREIGCKLFNRRGRLVELTAAGAELHGFVARGFAELRRGMAAVRKARPKDVLTIVSVPTFATAFLAARIEEFEKHCSGVRLRLELTQTPFDLDAVPADVAIGIGARQTDEMYSEVLLPLVSAPVCTPQLARKLTVPADLGSVTRISLAQYPNGWSVWLRATAAQEIKVQREVKFDAPATAILAALEGSGVLMAPLPIVAHHLQAGRLTMPFPQIFRSQLCYQLVCRKGEEKLRKIQGFRKWLRTTLSSVPHCYGGPS